MSEVFTGKGGLDFVSHYINTGRDSWVDVRIVCPRLQRYLLCDCRDCRNEMKRLTLLAVRLFLIFLVNKEKDYFNSYVKLNIHSLF